MAGDLSTLSSLNRGMKDKVERGMQGEREREISEEKKRSTFKVYHDVN